MSGLNQNHRSIPHPEGRSVLRPHLAPVIEVRRRDVRGAEPFLDLGDIRLVRERVRCGRRASRDRAALEEEDVDWLRGEPVSGER